MLVFDQLKKDDPHLRFLAFVVMGGFLILLTGLWWVQLVSTKYFQGRLEHQSTRTVGIPAVRGRILDRNGRPLAENRPAYSVDLYLDELSKNYQTVYYKRLGEIQTNLHLQALAKEKQSGRKLKPEEKKGFALSTQYKNQLEKQVRYEVTSDLLLGLSAKIQQPISLTQSNFEKWYDRSRMLPLPVLANLNASQIARFEEQSTTTPGVHLDVQSVRVYPDGTSGAHLLGYLSHEDMAEDRGRSFPAAGFAGAAGIEKIYDDQLHGEAGERMVVINNYGYRDSETIDSPSVPGQNIVLTIDADIQKAADTALERMAGQSLHGAVVVMDVRNGDILALASVPAYNPNHFIHHPEEATWEREWSRWTNEDLQVQMDHAVQGLYPPGSIFKIVVGLAGLENGTLNPREVISSPGYFPLPDRRMKDTAPAGDYDFNRALSLSCNFYFITNGLKPGVLPRVIALGQQLHLGERTGLFPRNFESRGYFPKPDDIKSSSWHLGNTANMSIGQDRLAVTPLQVAVMISAIANGGTIFYPRIVSRIEAYDSDEVIQTFPNHNVRDHLVVSARSLSVVREAMRDDVERPKGESTGHLAYVPGMAIYGKTGTAQVQGKSGQNEKSLQITWFGSFASMSPDESPKYAVVAMLAGGSSGGGTCAPIAHDVYLALQQMERKPPARPAALAQAR
jgi:penicillin-binding protein 2